MKRIDMPSFGADMAKGTVAQWKVTPGEEVKKGDIIASIETMKGLIDMEVFDDGIIENLLVAEGEEVKVGSPIAELRLKEDIPLKAEPLVTEQQPGSVMPTEPQAKQIEKQQPIVIPLEKSAIAPATSIKISPAAKFKAQQLGINWQGLAPGRGPEGAILLADIESLERTERVTETDKLVQPQIAQDDSGAAKLLMRKAIADVVSRSKKDIPHYYLELDVSVEKTKQWLVEFNADLPPEQRILINAVIYCAIARALMHFPEFNGFYQQDTFTPAQQVHLGNAISLRQGGLVVAAIHNAQRINLKKMMILLKDQVIRVREGGLRMSEMQDSTITVSNLGDRGCDRIQSIIFPPQVAIIGIGRQRSVPWVMDEKIVIANIVSISLAADHRVSDGHMGARLLDSIDNLLQQPERLL